MNRLIRADQKNVAAARLLLVNSRYMRERAWSVYARAATVCYLGVDIASFRPAPDDKRELEIISIGSPLFAKGHQSVITAAAKLPVADRPRVRIIGQSTRGADELHALAQGEGVELAIESQLDDALLAARYQRALMTVCAARLEPFGLTALESMACGTPVVAIDEAGYRETVVDGETGLLVEPNADALAAGIAALLGDPARRRRMGAAGRELTERCWTWPKSVARLEAILQRAVV